MKKTLNYLVAGLLGVIIGAVAAMIAPVALSIFGPPKVTLVNATGGTVSNTMISLGDARREVGELKDGQSLTAQIYGRFGECSTHVTWTDSRGRHEAIADDYVGNYGFYHTTVVLMPDAKAKAVYEIKESRQQVQTKR